MITPTLFYASCFVVVFLIAWLFFLWRDAKQKLKDRAQDVKRLTAENKRVNGEVEQAKADYAVLQDDRDQAASQLVRFKAAQEKYVGLVDDFKATNDGLKRDIQTHTATIAHYQEQLASAQSAKTKLQGKLEALRQQDIARIQADNAREVLTLRPKQIEGGQIRLQLIDPDDGRTLMVTPSGWLDEDKAAAVQERLVAARWQKGKGVVLQ